MKLELKRIFKGKEYSIGKLYIDGVYFVILWKTLLEF